MSRSITIAVLGALALGTLSFVAEPASAMPVAGLSPVAAEPAGTGEVEQARFVRRGFRRGFVSRRFVYRRPFGYYHRRAPLRRLIRRIL